MQSCVTLQAVNKDINEQMHTVVATFQGNLQDEANQVLQQVGEAKTILAEGTLEVIENQCIMKNQKSHTLGSQKKRSRGGTTSGGSAGTGYRSKA